MLEHVFEIVNQMNQTSSEIVFGFDRTGNVDYVIAGGATHINGNVIDLFCKMVGESELARAISWSLNQPTEDAMTLAKEKDELEMYFADDYGVPV